MENLWQKRQDALQHDGKEGQDALQHDGTERQDALQHDGNSVWLKMPYLLITFHLSLITLSCNPFAPKYNADALNAAHSLGNPVSIQGFFQLFKNAYELRDTSFYGKLFDRDFSFTYYDFDKGQEFSWDRATEMNSTYKLFQASEQINLDWNFFVQADTTDTTAYIVRNFNLSVVQKDQTAFSGTGRAKFRLRRKYIGDAWKAYYWFDDSDF